MTLTRVQAKALFEIGDKPTQAEFIQFIDAIYNLADDGQPLKKEEITQTLNAGNNTINHNLSKTVLWFSVKDGNDFVQVAGNIIDVDNLNLNLAAGSITNATITIIYEL